MDTRKSMCTYVRPCVATMCKKESLKSESMENFITNKITHRKFESDKNDRFLIVELYNPMTTENN